MSVMVMITDYLLMMAWNVEVGPRLRDVLWRNERVEGRTVEGRREEVEGEGGG